MSEIKSIKSSLDQLERLSDSLNIGQDLDKPTAHECFVFWKIQSAMEDRLHTRKKLIDVKHTSAKLSLL